MIKARKMTLETKPKGKTTVKKGNFRDRDNYLEILSSEAEIAFIDIDNYLIMEVKIEVSKQNNEIYSWSGEPLLKGNFKLLNLSLRYLSSEGDGENGKKQIFIKS